MICRYLDPKHDLAFKKIFGVEKHKRISIDFLNAALCLESADRIVDLQFLETKQAAEIDARKESIVDVLVRDHNGVKYVVEMQVAKIEGFEKRAQYYAAKTYCSHFGPGEKYADLKKVVFLAITDYVVFPKKKHYKSDHVILDNRSLERDLKDFSFTFVELPKFTKKIDELETIEEQWYYFLKHATQSNTIDPLLAQHSEIKEAYDILDRFHWTESELLWYDKIIMNVADAKGIRDAVIEEARQKGLEKGLEQGIEQGIEQGLRRSMREIVLRLMHKNYSLEGIVDVTGFSEQDVQQILKSGAMPLEPIEP